MFVEATQLANAARGCVLICVVTPLDVMTDGDMNTEDITPLSRPQCTQCQLFVTQALRDQEGPIRLKHRSRLMEVRLVRYAHKVTSGAGSQLSLRANPSKEEC